MSDDSDDDDDDYYCVFNDKRKKTEGRHEFRYTEVLNEPLPLKRKKKEAVGDIDADEPKQKGKKKEKKKKKKSGPMGRPVVLLDDANNVAKEFVSPHGCSLDLNLDVSTVLLCCNGGLVSGRAKGYRLRWKGGATAPSCSASTSSSEESGEDTVSSDEEETGKKGGGKFDMGQSYGESCRRAPVSVESSSNIGGLGGAKGKLGASHGKVEEAKSTPRRPRGAAIEVVDRVTGAVLREFGSQRAASEGLAVSLYAVRLALSGRKPDAGGHFLQWKPPGSGFEGNAGVFQKDMVGGDGVGESQPLPVTSSMDSIPGKVPEYQGVRDDSDGGFGKSSNKSRLASPWPKGRCNKNAVEKARELNCVEKGGGYESDDGLVDSEDEAAGSWPVETIVCAEGGDSGGGAGAHDEADYLDFSSNAAGIGDGDGGEVPWGYSKAKKTTRARNHW